jgi:lactose/L-arabinose transport system substrate-binding protein
VVRGLSGRGAVAWLILVLIIAGCGASTTPSSAGSAEASQSTAPASSIIEPSAAAPSASPSLPALVPDPSLSGTIQVWIGGLAQNYYEALDPAFAKAYPNIKVKYTVIDYGGNADNPGLYQNFQLAVTAGSGLPDVVSLEDSHLGQYVSINALADITAKVTPYLPFLPGQKIQEASKDGQIYAMPIDSGPVALYYRRDVFEKAGVDPTTLSTWDDWLAAAKVIKDKTGVPMWQQAKARNNARTFESLLWQQGLGYVDASGAVIVDKEPRIQQTLEFMGKTWSDGVAADNEEWTDPWYAAFNKGQVATHPGAVWMSTFFKSFIAPDAAGKFGVVPLPRWTADGSDTANDGGSSFAIPAASEQQAAAWAWIQFYTGQPSSVMTWYKASDIFPSLNAAYEDPYFQEPDPYFDNQKVRQFFAELTTQVPAATVYSSDYAVMNTAVASAIQRYAMGELSAQDALAAAAQEIRDKTGRS